jgi:hypothetical protein
MKTAGYMTTSVNYLWTLAFAFIAVYGMQKSYLNKQIQIWEYPVYICSLCFASNIEQMNILFVPIIALLFLYSALQKRINYYLLLQLCIVNAMLLFILTCTGNASRYAQEITRYPVYELLTVIEKIQLGYASALAHFIVSPNLVFATFCLLLYIAMHIQYSDMLHRTIAAVPLGSCILLYILNAYFSYDTNIVLWIHRIFEIKSATTIINYTPLFIICICKYLCVFISVFLLFKDNNLKAMLCIVLIILGFSSSAVMGFSPTIWVSSYRIFIFTYFVLIVCIILFYQRLILMKFKNGTILFRTIGMLGIISYLCSFLFFAVKFEFFRRSLVG